VKPARHGGLQPGAVGHGGPRHGAVRRFAHSLRWRLVLLFVLLALATAATFFFSIQQAMRGGWELYAKPLVTHYIDGLAREIGTPPSIERAKALTDRLPLAIRIEGPSVNWDSQPQRAADDLRDHRRFRDGEAFQTRTLADGHRIVFGLDGPIAGPRTRRVGWTTLVVLLVLTAVAYAVVQQLLRPLADIRAGAERFGRGEFDPPIAPRRDDELGDLALQINAMAASLRDMLDAKRALLLAISHELRSPLTRARVNAELIDEHSPPRDALLRDLAAMRDLITDLLESERLAGGHAALHAEPCDLNALVREVLEASFGNQVFEQQLDPAITAQPLDVPRIRLLLRNLLDNAQRHRGDGPAPIVRTAIEGGDLLIEVRDFGPGVPNDALRQLAEPFFRPDTARQRATGGVGLGLTLCRLVAQAHGGTITFRNAEPGLAVTVRLPAA
jgi:signal transduction histidine kinase